MASLNRNWDGVDHIQSPDNCGCSKFFSFCNNLLILFQKSFCLLSSHTSKAASREQILRVLKICNTHMREKM